ncbi:MAG: hypothetical protein ACLP0J_22275 [Solirubrobacteraceae bacterium]|jgi:hypothetical protein
MDVAALADLLHETAEHHGAFEAVAPPSRSRVVLFPAIAVASVAAVLFIVWSSLAGLLVRYGRSGLTLPFEVFLSGLLLQCSPWHWHPRVARLLGRDRDIALSTSRPGHTRVSSTAPRIV